MCFNGKSAAISATSPGPGRDSRGLDPLQLLLSHIGVNVVGNNLSIPKGFKAFDENGGLIDEGQNKMLEGIIEILIRIS